MMKTIMPFMVLCLYISSISSSEAASSSPIDVDTQRESAIRAETKVRWGLDLELIPNDIGKFVIADTLPVNFQGSYFRVSYLSTLNKMHEARTSYFSFKDTIMTSSWLDHDQNGNRRETEKVTRIGKIHSLQTDNLVFVYLPDCFEPRNHQKGLMFVDTGNYIVRLHGVSPDGAIRKHVSEIFTVRK
jgi:hypothetical protein